MDDYEALGAYIENWLEDERMNLNIPLKGGKYIVCFADMGLWHGRVNGAKAVGDNIKDIFNSGAGYDGVKFYADRYNVRAKLTHHDGTHYCLFRVAKSEEQAHRLVERIAYGGMTEKQFRKATRSLRPLVGKVYGWR
jgi:hypothetical protein